MKGRQTKRSLAAVKDPTPIVSLHQVLDQLDAYDESCEDNRRPAAELGNAVKDAMSPHLKRYLSADGNHALSRKIKGRDKCVEASWARATTVAPSVNDPSPCEHCEYNGCLCILKQEGRKPVIMPQNAQARGQAAADEPGYWLPLP